MIKFHITRLTINLKSLDCGQYVLPAEHHVENVLFVEIDVGEANAGQKFEFVTMKFFIVDADFDHFNGFVQIVSTFKIVFQGVSVHNALLESVCQLFQMRQIWSRQFDVAFTRNSKIRRATGIFYALYVIENLVTIRPILKTEGALAIALRPNNDCVLLFVVIAVGINLRLKNFSVFFLENLLNDHNIFRYSNFFSK